MLPFNARQFASNPHERSRKKDPVFATPLLAGDLLELHNDPVAAAFEPLRASRFDEAVQIVSVNRGDVQRGLTLIPIPNDVRRVD